MSESGGDPNELRIQAPELLCKAIAPGVWGYTMEEEGALWIPVLVAERPGQGNVGRYLDSLPRDRTIKVPNVLSSRLAGMLARRGFMACEEACQIDGVAECVEIWVREAKG